AGGVHGMQGQKFVAVLQEFGVQFAQFVYEIGSEESFLVFLHHQLLRGSGWALRSDGFCTPAGHRHNGISQQLAGLHGQETGVINIALNAEGNFLHSVTVFAIDLHRVDGNFYLSDGPLVKVTRFDERWFPIASTRTV
ncbi:MAG: hypothetical protein ACK6EB_41285, partial [Planctomyces sp.]